MCIRGQPFDRFDIEIKGWAIDRHGVFHPHHELDVKLPRNAPVAVHLCGLVNVAEVKGFDLWLDLMGAHLARQPIDQIRRVLINAGGKIIGPHRERSHIGAQRQHPAPRLPGTRPSACRELNDHAGAMSAHTLLQGCKFVRVRGGRFVRVAHMGVANTGPCLKSGMGAFDLFRDADRDGGIGRFGRDRAGDGNADDAGIRHGVSSAKAMPVFHSAPPKSSVSGVSQTRSE